MAVCGRLALVCAALVSVPAAAVQPGVSFQLRTADGEERSGLPVRLDADGKLLFGSPKSPLLDLRQWLALRRAKTPLPPHPLGPQVVFANGDRVPLAEPARIRLDQSRLYFKPAAPLRARDDTLAPPLSAVAVLWLGGTDGLDSAVEPALRLRRLAAAKEKKDAILLRDGDRVEGVLLALDSATGCRMQAGKRVVDIPWANIGAIVFNGDLQAPGLPDRAYLHLVLAGGARLGLASAQLQPGKAAVQARTLFDGELEFPLADLIALDVRRGSAAYLSDLRALKYEHVPFVGTSWPLALDGSSGGRELRLAGSTFDKGLGMHAEARVSYALGGKYRRFEALVGLDPDCGKKGRVRVRVLLDGKECNLGWKKELTAVDEPLVVAVDVRAARELTLEVLFGGNGDVQAHVNWADARLIE